MVSPIASSLTSRRTAVVRRGVAVLGVVSAVLHLLVLGEHGSSPAMVALMAAMALGCLYCSWHLWRQASVRDWALVAVMNIGMVGLHLFVMGGAAPHAHGAQPAMDMSSHSGGSVTAVATAMAAVEVVIATAVVFMRTRSGGQASLFNPARDPRLQLPSGFEAFGVDAKPSAGLFVAHDHR